MSRNHNIRRNDGHAQPWRFLIDNESRHTSDEDDEEQKKNDEKNSDSELSSDEESS